jgi:hypothetical protein
MSTIADLMRIAWNTVGAIVKRVYEDIKEERGSLFDGLRRIGKSCPARLMKPRMPMIFP